MSPCLLRHVLHPTDDGHAVLRVVAVIDEARSLVFCRIVRQGGTCYRTTGNSLVFSDGNLAQAFLHFADTDSRAIAERQRIGIFLFCLSDDVPHLMIIYDMLLGESYQPVARCLIAPVGIGNARGLAVSIVHVGNAPRIGLSHAYQICILGDRLEDERKIHFAACRDYVGLGQRDNCGSFHGVCLPVSR